MHKLNINLDDFICEGEASIEIDKTEMKLEAKTNFVLWFNRKFENIKKIKFEFKPQFNEGLAMIFFCANGVDNLDLFSHKLSNRNGDYPQYHSSDIDTFHASFYRRKWEDEKQFHVANLRLSPGFNLVAQGADPIPTVTLDNQVVYTIEIILDGSNSEFKVNDLVIYNFDNVQKNSGYIGLRHMAPLVATYNNFEVYYD